MRAEHTGQAAASVAAALACLSGRRADPSLAGSRCHSSRGCYVRPSAPTSRASHPVRTRAVSSRASGGEIRSPF